MLDKMADHTTEHLIATFIKKLEESRRSRVVGVG